MWFTCSTSPFGRRSSTRSKRRSSSNAELSRAKQRSQQRRKSNYEPKSFVSATTSKRSTAVTSNWFFHLRTSKRKTINDFWTQLMTSTKNSTIEARQRRNVKKRMKLESRLERLPWQTVNQLLQMEWCALHQANLAFKVPVEIASLTQQEKQYLQANSRREHHLKRVHRKLN